MRTSRAIGDAIRTARTPLTPITQRRHLQDVAITRTGKPIIRVQGGRSSLGGHVATVFGATGFLGRYIVNRLARQGCTVIVPYRDEMAKRHLKVTGDLGRVIFTEYDLRNTQSIEESVRHSDLVYNLVGRKYPTKNFSYHDVHVEGTERIAEAVAKYDCDRFIHVSSYNADVNSPSEFFSTKVCSCSPREEERSSQYHRLNPKLLLDRYFLKQPLFGRHLYLALKTTSYTDWLVLRTYSPQTT
jgi:NADH dehydrogenase (ubiquinone) 1 alpha subcomplex subunit 9